MVEVTALGAGFQNCMFECIAAINGYFDFWRQYRIIVRRLSVIVRNVNSTPGSRR
jgi:hypothetical protein